MRDAMGGTVTLVIIVVFIVFTLGYMAYNVNYTKAFRMKDKIIAEYEINKGECLHDCREKIIAYADEIGYSTGGRIKFDDYKCLDNLFCYKEVDAINKVSDSAFVDTDDKHYYKIVTKINLEIPVISNILNFRIFYLTGDTKSFTK